MQKEYRKCPYCGGVSRLWCPTDSTYTRCLSCKIVYRKVMPTKQELEVIYGKYYTDESIKNGRTRMVSSETSRLGHSKYIKKIIQPGSKILDFGAGTGDLAWELQQSGFVVEGVEYSNTALASAKSRYGFNFYSTLEELCMSQHSKFDLIIGVEVIEHLPRPDKVLDLLGLLLRPGGHLYLTTPNRNSLKARIRKCKWSEALKPVHLVLFNYRSLKKLLQDRGFNEVKYVRFSPLSTSSPLKVMLHRGLQLLGLYGGLRILATKTSKTV